MIKMTKFLIYLAANVIVNDTTEWTFGPEYSYNLILNTTYLNVPENSSMPNSVRSGNVRMKCRPKIPNRLLCIISNFMSVEYYMEPYMGFMNATNLLFPLFEIKYNKRGIESLLIDSALRTNEVKLRIIKRIANQLNPGIDLKSNRDTSHFRGVENTSMGNCMTKYEIWREKSERKLLEKNFTLFTLPMTDAKPGTTISIEKYRTRCTNVPRRLYFNRVFKMVREHFCVFNIYIFV